MCDRCTEFEGKRYHWDGKTPYLRCRGKLLHREIWKSAYGPIPAGHHVHHKDGDSSRNELENLELRDAKGHAAEHVRMGSYSSPARLEHLDRIRPLTVEWHRSDEGRSVHARIGRDSWKVRAPSEHVCAQCGRAFESLKPGALFCSNACKASARRESGVDDEIRACPYCGKKFTINRYVRPDRCCSRSCAQRKRAAPKT